MGMASSKLGLRPADVAVERELTDDEASPMSAVSFFEDPKSRDFGQHVGAIGVLVSADARRRAGRDRWR
jgi:hypothetical protein